MVVLVVVVVNMVVVIVVVAVVMVVVVKAKFLVGSDRVSRSSERVSGNYDEDPAREAIRCGFDTPLDLQAAAPTPAPLLLLPPGACSW